MGGGQGVTDDVTNGIGLDITAARNSRTVGKARRGHQHWPIVCPKVAQNDNFRLSTL